MMIFDLRKSHPNPIANLCIKFSSIIFLETARFYFHKYILYTKIEAQILPIFKDIWFGIYLIFPNES